MLHLVAQNRQVLLEMMATHVHATDCDPVIVLTGRHVDSTLAGLMRESGAEPSVSLSHDANEDDELLAGFPKLRSVSQAGSIDGDEDENTFLPADHPVFDPSVSSSRSSISDLTLPTIISGSDVSSLTLPSVLNGSSDISSLTMTTYSTPYVRVADAAAAGGAAAGRPAARKTVVRFVDDSVRDDGGVRKSASVASLSESSSIGLSHQLPSIPTGLMDASRSRVSWDSDNSSARALARLRPLRSPAELQARPILNKFLDAVRAARSDRSRATRQSRACRNAFTKVSYEMAWCCVRTSSLHNSEQLSRLFAKLLAIGRFVRLARERGAFRALLLVEGGAAAPHLAVPVAARRLVAEFMWSGGWVVCCFPHACLPSGRRHGSSGQPA